MDLVVDANILFSVLIKSGKTEELLFESDLHLFAPEFLFHEFAKHKDQILDKTSRTAEEFEELFQILKTRIATAPNEETQKYIEEAIGISPDRNDAEYLALALKLHCPVWSNDTALRRQAKVKIFSTEELARTISGEPHRKDTIAENEQDKVSPQ